MKIKSFIILTIAATILTGCSSPQEVESDSVSQSVPTTESSREDLSDDELKEMFDSLSEAYTELGKSALSNQTNDVITQYAEIVFLVSRTVENKLAEENNDTAEYLLMYAIRNTDYGNAVLAGDSEKQAELINQISRIINTLSTNYFDGYMPDSITSLIAEVEEMREREEREAEEKKRAEEEEKKRAEEAEKAKAKEEQETESISSEQSRAQSMAQRYLRTISFSKSGLKDQLVFEGFNDSDAQWAVDNIDVDWNEQAVKKAEDYARLMDMSNQGIYDQLIFEGFSPEQAQHGIDNMKD